MISISRLLAIAICGTGLLLVGCGGEADQSSSSSPETSLEARSGTSYKTNPQPVPDTTLTALDGQTIDLGAQDGRVLLVNFWATWCAPCRKEIPDLAELQSTFGDQGLTVIGVSLDEGGESTVRPFLEKFDVNYPIVVDPEGNVEAQFGAIYGLPTTYVVDSDGQIVRRIVGLFPTDEMRPKIEALLSDAEDRAA